MWSVRVQTCGSRVKRFSWRNVRTTASCLVTSQVNLPPWPLVSLRMLIFSRSVFLNYTQSFSSLCLFLLYNYICAEFSNLRMVEIIREWKGNETKGDIKIEQEGGEMGEELLVIERWNGNHSEGAKDWSSSFSFRWQAHGSNGGGERKMEAKEAGRNRAGEVRGRRKKCKRQLEGERKRGCAQSPLFFHSSFLIIELSNQCGA